MERKTIQSALIVAAVVGSILLLINQFDALFGDSDFRVVPAVLTYCVPFVVFIVGRVTGKK
jgi:hypothetical protein